MIAEYDKWYKAKKGTMPEDFENTKMKDSNSRKLVVVQTPYTDEDDGIDCQHREEWKEDGESGYQWQDYADKEVIAWKLPEPYKE